MNLIKSHAYGNDFLLLEERAAPSAANPAALARLVCERHRGLGADGLITFRMTARSHARMSLLNADGSYSEVSGNGVRCLAAWIALQEGAAPGASISVDTDAGTKELELLALDGVGFTFRAAMGTPDDVRMARIDVGGTTVDAVTMRVGNPQCVVLGEATPQRLHSLAAALAVHPYFPAGTNVELAALETPRRVRILIWERGVGPTEASGTGACAAAVAAMAYGGAARDVEVVAPGGAQRVEWLDSGLFLTGRAEVIAVCRWRGETALRA